MRQIMHRRILFLIVFASLGAQLCPGTVSIDDLEGPRQFLEIYEIDESYLSRLQDGRAVHEDEEETILRTLLLFPKMPKDDVERWKREAPPLTELLKNPKTYQTQLWPLTGLVDRVERITVASEIGERLGFSHYFRLTLNNKDNHYRVTLYARHVPVRWNQAIENQEILDEPVSVLAMFLKVGGADNEQDSTEIIAVTENVAWHPVSRSDRWGLTDSHLLLGRLKMDVGLLDHVKHKSAFRTEDREGFYALLDVVSRMDALDIEKHASALGLGFLISQHRDHVGRLVTIEGVARRAIRIVVEEEDIRRRYGIDHYFEVAFFVEGPVRLKTNAEDDEGTVVQTYPVILCARRLPDAMPVGDDIRVPIRAVGFFFKLWAYENALLSSGDRKQRQISPLLLGKEPLMLPTVSRQKDSRVGAICGLLFIVGLIGMWLGIRHMGHRNVTDRPVETMERLPESFPTMDDDSLD